MEATAALDAARRHWAHLPRGLLDHLERVSHLARGLAEGQGAEPELAALAGFLHDVARAEAPRTFLETARKLGLAVHPVEAAVPILLHGPIAAALARRDLGLQDQDALAAIAWHTTGRWEMSPLEKAVFLADKLDPEKEGYYPGLEGLPDLARRDPERALLEYLDWQIKRLLEGGGLVHPATVEARNWLLRTLSDRGRHTT